MVPCLGLADKNIEALYGPKGLQVYVLIHVIKYEEGLSITKNLKQNPNHCSDISSFDTTRVYRSVAKALYETKDLGSEPVAFFATVSPVPEVVGTVYRHRLFLQKSPSKCGFALPCESRDERNGCRAGSQEGNS